jgi:hypothetical protein
LAEALLPTVIAGDGIATELNSALFTGTRHCGDRPHHANRDTDGASDPSARSHLYLLCLRFITTVAPTHNPLTHILRSCRRTIPHRCSGDANCERYHAHAQQQHRQCDGIVVAPMLLLMQRLSPSNRRTARHRCCAATTLAQTI